MLLVGLFSLIIGGLAPAWAQEPPAEYDPAYQHYLNPHAEQAQESDAPSLEDQDLNQLRVERKDYDPDAPYYHKLPSKWAFGFRIALYGFPVSSALGTSIQLYGEYSLPWQKLGIWSIGPHIGSFPLYAPNTPIPYPEYENALMGLALRYQFKYFPNQLLVPTAAIEWEFYRVQVTDTTPVTGADLGFSLGMMINLGFLDEGTARNAFDTLGLLRTYLTLELRSANISNSVFSLTGSYWFTGVRFEFR